MDTQTFELLAIIGAALGLVSVTIYSFRKIGGINKTKFEHFKRATSLRQSSRDRPKPTEMANMH